jgi:cytidyltransferase-like protein
MILNICWGFFAPLHTAHLDLFEATNIPNSMLLVLINSDEQLAKKKNGLIVMNEKDRIRIIKSIKYVDQVEIIYNIDQAKQIVIDVIKSLKPKRINMCMGGDKSDESKIDEDLKQFCQDLNINIKYGVGGKTKTESSSNIIQNIIDWLKTQ